MSELIKTKINEFGEPICPICGHIIEIENMIDGEESVDKDCDYKEYGYGYCWGCGEMYHFNIAYKFAYYEIDVERK